MGRYVTPLELLILTAVHKCAADSVYRLYSRLALSPGVVRATVETLVRRGALQRVRPGKRGLRVLELTDPGVKILKHDWQAVLREVPEDGDAVVRIACSMLMLFPTDPEHASSYLETAAKDPKQTSSTISMTEARDSTSHDALGIYRWMRAQVRAREFEADAVAFRELAAALKNNYQGVENKNEEVRTE